MRARASVVALGLPLFVAAFADAAPRPPARPAPHGVARPRVPKPPPPKPAPPLPSLPSIPRVRIELSREHAVIVEEVNLPRGTWRSGDIDVYVAFGAPGMPRAVDAHVIAVREGELEPRSDDPGEVAPVERAARCPVSAQPLLGRSRMAGVIVHAREATLGRAFGPGQMAAFRIRSLIPLPPEDGRGGREIIARLGIHGGAPLTLGRIQLVSLEGAPAVQRATAQLCGAEADSYPLAVRLTPAPTLPVPLDRAPTAPVLAVRHPSDDLCIRFWNTP